MSDDDSVVVAETGFIYLTPDGHIMHDGTKGLTEIKVRRPKGNEMVFYTAIESYDVPQFYVVDNLGYLYYVYTSEYGYGYEWWTSDVDIKPLPIPPVVSISRFQDSYSLGFAALVKPGPIPPSAITTYTVSNLPLSPAWQ